MTYSPSTRAVSDVMRNVERAFGDESGVLLEQDDIVMWINDASDEIVKRNRMNKAISTSSSIVGQSDYTYASLNIMQIESIHYGGQRLPNMSYAEAEEQVIGQDAVAGGTGEPALWYEWAGTFTFYPVPPTVQTIAIYYTAQPTHVSGPTDILPLPDKYYNDIVTFVLQKAYEMSEDWQAAQFKGQQFDASLLNIGEEEREAQNMTYDSITVLDWLD